jgi:peptide/nickel transport system substrate-binding protein
MAHLLSRRQGRRPLALLIAAPVAAGLALTGCGPQPAAEEGGGATGEPVYGGTLTVARAATPAIIDPFATSLQADWVVARNVCEPLFDVSTSFEIKPVLVEDYQYDDDRTYVLDLREEAGFHDGEPLTADDVISSIERYFETPGNGSILAGMTDSLEATGDRQVTIVLNQPSALLPTLLTTAYIMPASVVDDRPATDAVTDLVCTGPYTLTSYSPDGDVVLDRWDDYVPLDEPGDGGTGAKHAYADSIVFTPIPEESTRIQATETGQIDIGGYVGLDNYESIVAGGNAQAQLLSPNSGSTIVFNKVEGVMSDPLMRKAFLAALNMDDIMTAGFGNPEFFTADGSLIPASNETWATEAGTQPFNAQDLDLVAELLDEAGYGGERIVWMTTEEEPSWFGPSLPAQQQLREAGLNIDLQVVDRATLIDRRTRPDEYDIFSSGIPTYADPVLLPYLQETFPGSWVSEERDRLLEALSTESDQDARKALWEELQTLVWDELPFLKFGTTRPLAVTGNDVHTEHVDELGDLYYNTWIDQD